MLANSKRELAHFCHNFHPAGHGTLFSGRVRQGESRKASDDFVWIYDCGSKRRSHLRGLIEALSTQLAPKNCIDMLCISHFDDDHVCGIELLLKEMRAGILVLPYLSLEARLRIASQVLEEGGVPHQLAAMTLDPSRFLAERGLSDRFDRIVLVRGGGGGANETPSLGEPPSDPDRSEGGPCPPAFKFPSAPLGEQAVGHQQAARISVAEHGQPWEVGGLYEFCFYNTALAGDVAPRSSSSLKEIAEEVAHLITEFDLCSGSIPKAGWCDKLKACYSKHFGTTAKRKNDISLCVLGRPQAKGVMNPCELFRSSGDPSCIRLDVRGGEGGAVLLMGDINLDKQELAALRRHVGVDRWDGVRVMQIPHHGSRRSWKPGTSSACVHEYSVVCAPPNKHHPHEDVCNDLAARNVVVADYDQSVSFDFHIG